MRTTEIIYPNLSGIEMRYDKIDILVGCRFDCFVIAEHTSDRVYIEKQAEKLLLAGSQEFFFYGKYCEVWHEIFDITYVRMFLNGTAEEYENGIVTICCDDVEELAEIVFDMMCTRTSKACTNLLIYDDELLYNQLIRQVEWLKRQNMLFHKVRLALKEMNPYCLLPDAPANEFYGEAERIAEQIQVSDSAVQISKIIAGVLTESFGDQFTVEECMEYAERLKEGL